MRKVDLGKIGVEQGAGSMVMLGVMAVCVGWLVGWVGGGGQDGLDETDRSTLRLHHSCVYVCARAVLDFGLISQAGILILPFFATLSYKSTAGNHLHQLVLFIFLIALFFSGLLNFPWGPPGRGYTCVCVCGGRNGNKNCERYYSLAGGNTTLLLEILALCPLRDKSLPGYDVCVCVNLDAQLCASAPQSATLKCGTVGWLVVHIRPQHPNF